MRVALGQIVGTPGNVMANLALMERLAADAARQGGDLLLLPELFLSGYNIGADVQRLAEPLDGPSAGAARDIAAEAGIAIAYGYPERAPEGVYNSAAIIDRSGRFIANYRKTHLWGPYERAQFLPGQRSEVFELDGIRFGFMICYDIDFPELSRGLALAGADAIIALSATTASYPVVPRHLIPARAYENRLFVFYADRAGEERGLAYAGESCIAAPDGSVVASCGQDEALVVGIADFERFAPFRRDHRFGGDRRPELYRT